MYEVYQKCMMVFEVQKTVCPLHGTSLLTIIMSSDVWCLVELQQWPMQHRVAVVESFIKSRVCDSYIA
jgi:hypothetical protein